MTLASSIIALVVAVAAVYLTIKLGSFLLVFFTLLREKRHIRFLAEVSAEERADVDDYIDEARLLALSQGFEFINTYAPNKGPWRDILVDLWLDADHGVIGLVSTGFALGMMYSRTTFHSVFENGRRLTTSDNFDEGDPVGIKDLLVRPGLSFTELYTLHRQRIEETENPPMPVRIDPLVTLEDLDRAHVQRMVDKGMARYRDLTRNCWSYTFRGACEVYYTTNPEQLREYKAYEKSRLRETTE